MLYHPVKPNKYNMEVAGIMSSKFKTVLPEFSSVPGREEDRFVYERVVNSIIRANFKSIGFLVLITCFFVRQNRFGALIQTFSQKTAKNQISGRFPPLPSTRDVLDILLFTSA